MFNLAGRKLLLIAAAWLLLWFVPWALWLEALPWLRLGVAILVFMLPGLAISLLLVGGRLGRLAHLTVGLSVSTLIISGLGLLGRVLHLPFDYIRIGFALTGLVGLLVLYRRSSSETQAYRLGWPSLVGLVIFLLMVTLGTLVNLQSQFAGDDFSYLAYLTSWQYAQPLNFHEVFFASGGLDAIRFWTAMFPMTTAFLAQISNIHGLLLLGLYLEPFLIALALLAAYNLYRELLLSLPPALGALLLQFAFLYLLRGTQQPGISFFARLSEDKTFAAFVLAPVFFLALRLALESLTIRTGLLVLLSGLSISFVHPIILAYSLFIGGVYVGIVTLLQRNYRKLALLALLMGLTLLPSAPLRFVRVSSAPTSFDLESALEADPNVTRTRITAIEGTSFYGFKLERIKIDLGSSGWESLFSWVYVLVLVLGFVWSLANIRSNAAAPLLAAASLLVLVCLIPYTGWLMGYFVTARMLWRSPWLMPVGLSAMVLVADSVEFVLRKIPGGPRLSSLDRRAAFGLALAGSLALLIYLSVSVFPDRWERLSGLPQYVAGLERSASFGTYLEQHIEEPSRFIAPPGMLMNTLPGLSSKSKVVFFRMPKMTGAYIRPVIDRNEMNTVLSSSDSISVRDRSRILRRFQIRYIVTQDASVKDYYAGYPDTFQVEQFAGFWIVEFLRAGS